MTFILLANSAAMAGVFLPVCKHGRRRHEPMTSACKRPSSPDVALVVVTGERPSAVSVGASTTTCWQRGQSGRWRRGGATTKEDMDGDPCSLALGLDCEIDQRCAPIGSVESRGVTGSVEEQIWSVEVGLAITTAPASAAGDKTICSGGYNGYTLPWPNFSLLNF